VRTPIGRGRSGGALAGVHPVDLLATALRALIDRTGIDPALVDDVIAGCVSQVGEQGFVPARMAALAAGFPIHVPGTTVDRKCGSGQQAVLFAVQAVMSGMQDIVIAAGVESMSRVPMGSAYRGSDPFGPLVRKRFSDRLVGQGIAAELVSARYNIGRDALDLYSAASHWRAALAQESGAFADEICPVVTNGIRFDADETIRPDTSFERLSALEPAFFGPDTARRHPEIQWRITAGNASQISDGAAAMLIMSEAKVAELGMKPRARVVASDVRGVDPIEMLTGPIPATQQVLVKAGMRLTAIDHYEVNEAFACVPLAWQMALDADPAKLNPLGGAIALGHPLGASGVRLMTTMISALVTGGASGLGHATAHMLAARGAHVVIVDLAKSDGERVAAELGGRATFVAADVNDDTAIEAALDIAEAQAPLRALVHCAGKGGPLRILDRDGRPAHREGFEDVVRVNLFGTFNLLRLAAARMAARPNADGDNGVCVLTASIAAYEGQIGQLPYAASKGGVVSMTLVAARDLAQRKIRVCAIAPGIFDTPMMARVSADVRQALAASIPHPSRMGAPEDFARLALHIIENQMLNGEVIRLDGALRMGPR
jgi:acetyl-CoA acetyltransferase family protein